ncbi:MarR family winged helix-turn-helix transcriptional regulator [Alloyangia pacifica]|uniref:DNA-binding transcriptional regulator, MarR family n=1 Tax=Alloyangia pacifica TaxID=311180 RepID=A0A1I6TIQ0_9RHOB|nr:MarR family transcriptional regulator [Alloyangia pacifica]SDH17038.1 DNA-binding transcriptional regulator, MarR family [Alloyangia pacifica]SFS89008.1 DNA-binding transcriptional regulator, MarR family [Alloyangia pacifica]
MSETTPALPREVTLEVRDRCLCFRAQRGARALGRRFDIALKPVGLTNGQFSILMSLNRPEPPRISDLAPFLAMDRTTLTAALKVLERRGLVESAADAEDKRGKRLRLSPRGHAILHEAMPIWRREHDAVEAALDGMDLETLKAALMKLGEL